MSRRASLLAPGLILLTLLPALRAQEDSRRDDLAAARALFERNIAAIQQRDREAYLACYADSERLLRVGSEGPALGFAELAEGSPATGSDEWPAELRAQDMQLHWISPGLVFGSYRYQVSAGGALRAGLSERVFRLTDAGWRIVVSTAFDASPGTPAAPLALVGATLIDGMGGPAVADAVVVLRDGRIESVGPRASTPVPDGVEVVDLSGHFLAPGLIDTHVHYSQTGWADGRPDSRDVRESYPYAEAAAELERHPERFHRAFLAAGVTSVFDVGGFPWTRRLGDATEDDPFAPHVLAAGPLLTTWVPELITLPDRSQFVLMESEDGVRAAVAAAAAGGADAIKVWYVLLGPDTLERFAPLVHVAGAASREHGLPLVVHATQLETARVAVAAGARLLVHSVDDAPVDEAFVQALVDQDVAYCPTLTVMRGYLELYAGELSPGLERSLDGVHPWVAERARATNSLGLHPAFDATRLAAFRERQAQTEQVMAANLRTLHAAGVRVVAGTDAGNPLTLHGPSMLTELIAMQQAGLSAHDVLVAATGAAATALGRDDLGRLVPGAIADLLVLTRDPSADISNMSSLTHVIRAGTLHTRATLVPR